MDLSLPEESVAFAEVVDDWAIASLDEGRRAWQHTKALAALGVFQLAGPDAIDPEHQHLNVSLVLERLAAAGVTGPLAETIWAAAHAGADIESGGWVGARVPVERDGAALVPYGRHVRRVLGTGPALLSADGFEEAYVPMSEGATWLPIGAGAALEAVDQAFAWMSYASLTLGYCERLMDLALLQTRDRRAFGTELLTFQAPRFALVEAYQLIAGLRPAVRDVAWRLDEHLPGATGLAATTWILAADVGRRVAINVHQVMGAASFPSETGVTAVTGAMSLLRLGAGTDTAVQTLWDLWRSVRPDRPANIAGVFGAAGAATEPHSPARPDPRRFP